MKSRSRFRLVAIAVATSAALALTACGPAGTTPDDEGSQTLRLSLTSPPSNFTIGSWSGGDATLFMSVYDTLLIRELDGTLSPGIAESWEYSDDRLQLTLKIREGMTFTDDTPVDAAAVVASLEQARTGASTSQIFSSIASVEATDDSTVVVTLSHPDAAFVPNLSGTPGAIGSAEVLSDESSQLWPVGSGAYVLDEDETTAGATYVLKKNPDHWNADAYPYEEVDVQIIQDATAAQNAVRAGQLDYAGITPDVASQFEGGDFTTGTGQPVAIMALWLVDREGGIVPALSDIRVRQAINLAIDRDSIAANLNPGTNNASNQVFSPTGEAFSEDLLDETPYDVERAKELLAEAGYADGFELTLPSTVVSTTYESILSQALSDIGITVTWEPVPFQDFYAKVFGGTYAAFFMANGPSGSDSSDAVASLSGLFNPFGSTDPELQALLDTANAASEEEQGEAYRAVNEWLVENAWFAPVSYVTSMYVTPSNVEYTPPVQFGQGVRPFKPASAE